MSKINSVNKLAGVLKAKPLSNKEKVKAGINWYKTRKGKKDHYT